ncbi:MAG: aminotransferase class V-fold PLP-dependent enzyme, partial [Alphaproteobacteria bacterium]
RTKLIAITHVPMHEGMIQPVRDIGRVARTAGLLFLLDACQAVGQLEVNVKEIGCHILTGTGRKYLRGPRGTGFLYVSSDIGDQLDPPFVDMRAAKWTGPDSYELMPGAKRFEAFESNIAGHIGLAAAVAYAHDIGMHRIEARIRSLADQLRGLLDELDGIEVHDRGDDRSGIVTFTKSGVVAVDMADRLKAAGITIAIARREQAWRGLGERGLSEVIRASVHVFNTEDEISRLCDVVSSA